MTGTRNIVQTNDDGVLVDAEPRVLDRSDSQRAYDFRRQADPVLSVPIKPVLYGNARFAFYEGDGSLELERADTGAKVVVQMLAFRGDSRDFCFVGCVGNQVVTVIVDQAYDRFIYDGGPITKAYNWPDSAEQANQA